MRVIIHFLIFLSMAVSVLHAQEIDYTRENERLLIQLDEAIAHKAEYQQARLYRADSLREAARQKEGYDRVRGLQGAYEVYNRFLTDSVASTLTEIKQCPEYKKDTELRFWTTLSEARNYGVMGLYNKSFDLLSAINPDDYDQGLQLHYYNTIHAVTNWMGDFASKSAKSLAAELRKKEAEYYQIIYELEPDPFSRMLIHSNMMAGEGLYQQSIDTLTLAMNTCDPSAVVYYYYALSLSYYRLGNEDAAVYYLAKASLDDITNGVAEYMALPILAEHMQMLKQGERAYNYLICSLEDANLCHSSLRAIEATTIFPIIDEARRAEENRRRQGLQTTLFMGVICVILIIGLIVIFLMERNKHALIEVRQKKKHLEEITYIAEHDELTGLLNRYGGKRPILNALKNHKTGYFCMLDIDQFKMVNDTFGHEVGDKVLQAVAACFNAMPEQIAARMGGDEFWSYCTSAITAEQYRARIEDFFTAVRAIRIKEMGDTTLSVSLGAIYYDGQSDTTFDQLFREADRRLYVSKQTPGCMLTM